MITYSVEEAIIGSIAVDAAYSLPLVKQILKAEHFNDTKMGFLYQRALDLDRERRPIDAVTLTSGLDQGLRKRFFDICEGFPGASAVEAYRDIVIREHHERNLLKAGVKSPTPEVIETIQNEWRGIQSLGAKRFDLSEKLMAYADVLEKRGKGLETFYPTGFPTLDYKVPLLKRGEMCMIGARTSMGKTSLLLAVMLKMAKAGLKIVFCSGEMAFNQLMDRILSLETSVSLLDIRKGTIPKAGWPKITNTLAEIAGSMKIRFVEAARLSLDKIMPHVIEFKPDVMFVDYIQRFSPDGKTDSRAAFYSDVANGLKGLAVEKDIVVIAASQLGRGVEQRKDRPRLSDLKESGGLEEAADVVWALHAEKEPVLMASVVEYQMLILKNRNGPTFDFKAVFNPTTARFYEQES